MNICEKNKVLLFHNPKTGGQFIRHELFKANGRGSAYKYWGPYSREINTDPGHINRLTIARFLPDYRKYKLFSFVRNPYNRFISAFETARANQEGMAKLIAKHPTPLRFLRFLESLDYYEQDRILRSPEVPWFNPQSYYTGSDVEILRYESEQDWKYICDIFGIPHAQVKIKPDYTSDPEVHDMLFRLYFDDERIFEIYK